MTGLLNQSLKRSDPTRDRDSEIRLRKEEESQLSNDRETSSRFLLESALDLRVEVSEGGGGVRVEDWRVDVWVVVVDEASLCGLVDKSVLQHVLATQKDRQPFVVADVLVLSDVDATSFLEQSFVFPLRVDALESVGKSVVFAEKDNLKNGESWVLVESGVTAEVASFLWSLHVARGSRVRILWRPVVSAAVLDQHSSAGEGSDRAILLLRVSVDQRQVHVGSDNGELLGGSVLLRSLAVVVSVGQSTDKIHALDVGLGVGWVVLWHNNWIASCMLPTGDQFSVICATSGRVLSRLGTASLHGHVVSHDLAPLHVGNGVLRIGDVVFTENNQRDQSWVRQVLTRDGVGRAWDAIAVARCQKAAVSVIRRTPHWVLQIVASTVEGTVLWFLARRRHGGAHLWRHWRGCNLWVVRRWPEECRSIITRRSCRRRFLQERIVVRWGWMTGRGTMVGNVRRARNVNTARGAYHNCCQ